jgi:hypothetical protein
MRNLTFERGERDRVIPRMWGMRGMPPSWVGAANVMPCMLGVPRVAPGPTAPDPQVPVFLGDRLPRAIGYRENNSTQITLA